MAVLDGHHDAGDETEPVGAALGKVVRALPTAVAEQVQAIRRTTAPAPDRGAARPDPATTIALVQASSQNRRVRLRYRSEAGTEWVTEADPWAVVVRHGRWYLLCRAGSERAVRAYRLDRMRDVEPLDEPFERPADLDPVAMLEQHLAVGWEYAVEVVVESSVDQVRPLPLPRARPARGGRRRSHPADRDDGEPVLVRRAARGHPRPVPRVGGVELRHTVAGLGRRLLDASPNSDSD